MNKGIEQGEYIKQDESMQKVINVQRANEVHRLKNAKVVCPMEVCISS